MRRHEFFHITKHARTYDRQAGKFIFNITYETATQVTPRTIGVAEAFGLGIDAQERFVLYDNVELKIGTRDIVFISGDSGSGKSVLLKAIKDDLGKEALDIAEIQFDQHKPIIETIGRNLGEGLELLSRAGLNDAFLFVRRFCELSDGQKYRYKIAKLMESQAQWWLADEFCSTLDRDTAKIVAFNLQKLARQTKKACIVATTHTDLLHDLKPSVHVHKRFGKEVSISYHTNRPVEQCTLTRPMRITKGTYADYKKLSIFHYRTSRCPAPRRIFILKRKDELCGVIVYSYPPPNTFGRSRLWKGTFKQLQQQISTITRVIVHPKYRTIGLGAKLVKETLDKSGTPFNETLAVMAKYNPFFEKAGMQKIMESQPNEDLLLATKKLHQLGFDPLMLGSLSLNKQKIMAIGKQEIREILTQLSKKEATSRKRLIASETVYPKHEEFRARIDELDEEGLAKVLKRLNFLVQTKVYLFWKRGDEKEQNRGETCNRTEVP